MERIPMQARGKRPRFFPEAGADETVGMVLELMSEIWTVRERLYALERVAAERGLDLGAAIEEWQPDAAEEAELDAARRRMIESVLRTVEARHVPGRHLRRSIDAAGPESVPPEPDVFRAA